MSGNSVHFDEARRGAVEAISGLVGGGLPIYKAVLLHDLFGVVRVVVWPLNPADEEDIRVRIDAALNKLRPFWQGETWISSAKTPYSERIIYESAWDEGILVPGTHDKVRLDDRVRTRTAWLPRFREPLWKATSGHYDIEKGEGPPIVVFYSFKGGVGRTTTLAACAIQHAQAGGRVLVIDFDLDAPGAGLLLAGDGGEISAHGVADYLLEAQLCEVRLRDYMHRCVREAIVGEQGGEMLVMPAGKVDDVYNSKLSRLDLEIFHDTHPLERLLRHAREEIKPTMILVDSRAGLSQAAGLLLDGIANLHMLFGTSSPQSQAGLEQVIHQLGQERILRRHSVPQADCILVHAMMPEDPRVQEQARAEFSVWADRVFRYGYYMPDPPTEDENEDHWYLRDMEEQAAPHQAVSIPYQQRFALLPSIDKVADELTEGPYKEVYRRIQLALPDAAEE